MQRDAHAFERSDAVDIACRIRQRYACASGRIAGNCAKRDRECGADRPITGESIQTNGGEVIALSALEHRDEHAEAAVYYTSEISPEAMVALYNALGVELTGDRIAVKLSTGDRPPAIIWIRT